MTRESGQASVELVALAPLLALVALAAAQLLAAGAAGELAEHAAGAAAVALLQGADPAAAARDAVPGWSARRMSVRVDGRRVTVRLRPPSPIPGLAGALEATGVADAGPELSLDPPILAANPRRRSRPSADRRLFGGSRLT